MSTEEKNEKAPILPIIIVGVSGLLSLTIVVLWIRYLYNVGAPRK